MFSHPLALPLIIYGVVVAGLLAAELREDARAQYFFKPLAALGFVILALYFGALESRYGITILIGLLFCATGDVFLLARKSEPLFVLGMGAFALGHLSYLFAFVPYARMDFGLGDCLINAVIIAGAYGFYHWLKPNLPRPMRWPVAGYTLIILFMVLFAVDLPWQKPLIFATIGAGLFAVSDMFVARDRFVMPDPKNALAITPLYFAAQALFALSVQI